MAYAATQTRNMDRALAAETAAKEAGQARAALADFTRMIAGWREALSHEPHGEVVRQMLDESGLTGMWQQGICSCGSQNVSNREQVTAKAGFEVGWVGWQRGSQYTHRLGFLTE